MKKIIFCVQGMYLGGTEKVMLSFLSQMDRINNEVTIAVIEDTGILMSDVPKNVKVIKLPLSQRVVEDLTRGGAKKSIKHFLKKGKFFTAAKIAVKKILGNNLAELRDDFDAIKALDGHYDVAIDYSIHAPFLANYVAYKINADRKCVFIHNDFFTTGYNISKMACLQEYQNIYAVSQKLQDEFVALKPTLASRTQVFHNVIEVDKIRTLGEEFVPQEYNTPELKILSVGRLAQQKGFDMAIDVAKKLKAEKVKFVWYIIGVGELRDELDKKIIKNGVGDCVRLLGARANPYPYMKYCDIYTQPSRHEGYCTTTNECKIFNKPIITTDVAGAREQFESGVNGIICQSSVMDIFAALRNLIEDKALRDKLSAQLEKENKSENNTMLTEWNKSLE